MELIEKLWVFLTLYLPFIIFLQTYQNCFSRAFQINENVSLSAAFRVTEKVQLEYKMLLEFELRKSELLKKSHADSVYTDLYVIQTNDIERAQSISAKYGFTFIRKVFEDENFYLFKRRKCKRRRKHLKEFQENFRKNPDIQWTARQSLQYRDQRAILRYGARNSIKKRLMSRNLTLRNSLLRSSIFYFNDPLYNEQWYLHNWGQTGSPPENDINVLPVWQSGITGRGVTIAVLDDGVYRRSAEIAQNYDSVSSEEYLFRSTAFQPIQENSHGTLCAAIAAGVANNSLCGVGVAYEAKIGGVRVIDGPLTDVQEALSLVHALGHVDIYTASWGPDDRGREVDGPQILARMALIRGVTMGRQGKGSIYVWAAGNGGGYYDNCSLDGYASSPFTLTIGALTEDGQSTFYTEPCPSVIASTYVGGIFHSPPSEKTWQEGKKTIKIIVPEGRGKCKETFQGTSAAAPMAAGIFALVLQANPSLTWRDVQHLIIRTSRVPDTKERGWFSNGAGFTFHPKIGSGVLDAHALVKLANRWPPIESLRVWTQTVIGRWLLLPKRPTSISFRVQKSSMHSSSRIDQLETVIITANIRHMRRGDLNIILQSPTGTVSPVLTRRPYDNSTAGFSNWDFASLHFWGEDPQGLWVLKISNHNERFRGLVDYLSVTLHGTNES